VRTKPGAVPSVAMESTTRTVRLLFANPSEGGPDEGLQPVADVWPVTRRSTVATAVRSPIPPAASATRTARPDRAALSARRQISSEPVGLTLWTEPAFPTVVARKVADWSKGRVGPTARAIRSPRTTNGTALAIESNSTATSEVAAGQTRSPLRTALVTWRSRWAATAPDAAGPGVV
jgi:hypothetical protein